MKITAPLSKTNGLHMIQDTYVGMNTHTHTQDWLQTIGHKENGFSLRGNYLVFFLLQYGQ